MPTKKEKTAFELFQYGYVDSIIAARANLSIDQVKELRVIYNTLGEKVKCR